LTIHHPKPSRGPWNGHYFDSNASEIPRPEAGEAFLDALAVHGNPASVHGAGRAARRLLEDCRETIAVRYGAPPDGLVFTSGGTEADALAVRGLGAGRRVLIGATEHDAVRMAAPGAGILPVQADGTIDLEALERALANGPAALVCLMLANNETGVLHPIIEAAALCRRHGALLHVDAVQAAGRTAVSLDALGAASLAVSSHKLGGMAGAGALMLADGVELAAPLIAGGGQELGRRGGTPALAVIASFAAAANAEPADLSPLRDLVEARAMAAGATVCGAGAPRLPNTSCLALPGRDAASQLIALDLAGFAVSSGAACSSGRVGRSHVLAAMDLGGLAGQAIRVSLPWNATRAGCEAFADAYASMAAGRAR
jgi:cysteine desulfurase